jgi:GT2 family glycosyltransferase
VAAAFGFITQPPTRNTIERWRGRHLFKGMTATEPQHGASLATSGALMRLSAVQRVGGFDATLREAEDADLGERLLAAGFDVIFDPKLFVTATKTNTLREVLERYTRWNTRTPMSVRDYVRQIFYSIKVMAREDLRAGDPLAALISLASPHHQFWSKYCHRR